jgi:hypothetical protein
MSGWAGLGAARVSAVTPENARDGRAVVGISYEYYIYGCSTIKIIAPDGIPQLGLLAEQVEKVNPDLVVRDEDGKVSTVRYEAVNAMLLSEFLKEHGKVETLEGIVTQQQKQIEALAATVQKVSDQIALSKPAPQLVANP